MSLGLTSVFFEFFNLVLGGKNHGYLQARVLQFLFDNQYFIDISLSSNGIGNDTCRIYDSTNSFSYWFICRYFYSYHISIISYNNCFKITLNMLPRQMCF